MHITAISELTPGAAAGLLASFGLELVAVPPGADIEASHWGAPEAGIVGHRLFARPDTPVHSVLHTAGHFICMDGARRERLHTDCGGTDPEENAVCYLQSLLADRLPGYGRGRLWRDMDAWGYSFRLGSAQAWFERDAQDAREWLVAHGIITAAGEVTGKLRA